MTRDSEPKFVISASLPNGSTMGLVNHDGELVQHLAGAMVCGFDEALDAGAILAARLMQGVYVQPMLFGQIDIDAEPIYLAPPHITR